MGHRPIPTGPVYDFESRYPDRRHANDGPAYLYIPLEQFIAEMRKTYDDWGEFEKWMEDRCFVTE